MTRFNLCVLALLGITLFGCSNETNSDIALEKEATDASTDGGPIGVCSPVASATRTPARSEAQKGAPTSSTQVVYVDDLYNKFVGQCGGCHVDVGLGNAQTSRSTFADVVDQSWVDSMGYNQLNTVMPPPSVGGTKASDRAPDDPSNELQA